MKLKGRIGIKENRIAFYFIIFLLSNLLINALAVEFQNCNKDISIVGVTITMIIFILYIFFVRSYKKEIMFLLLYSTSNIAIVLKSSGDFSGFLMLIISFFYAFQNTKINIYLFIFYAALSFLCFIVNSLQYNYSIVEFANNLIFIVLAYFIIKDLLNLKGVLDNDNKRNEENNNNIS